MRSLLPILLAQLVATTAFADDTLRCDLTRGSEHQTLSAALSELNAEVKATGLDASLGTSTFFEVLDSADGRNHVAFSGSARGVTPDGSTLSLTSSSSRCSLVPEGKFSLAPPPSPVLPEYFVCIVDEAHFVKGEIAETKRRALHVVSPLAPRLLLSSSGEDEAMAYSVNYLSYDPFHGLEIRLVDKATGEVARYDGPARSMLASLLFGLTIGNRDVDARFLRLGCVWTDDPKQFN